MTNASQAAADQLGPGTPGMSGIHRCLTNTRNTPVERDLEVLEPAVLSLITERRRSQPWGIEGGSPGATGENWLLPGGREEDAHRLPDKVTMSLGAGDVVRIRTPGGGGWGSPVGT